jgi:protein translocase SecG subunit
MTCLTNAWFIISILVINFILLTDSKVDISPNTKKRLNLFFTSRKNQNIFVRKFMWVLIFTFYLLTLSLNYNK